MAPRALALVCAVLALASAARAATVYETAVAAKLTTLVAAIDAAGLKGALNDPALVATVFAPTDAAFAELLASLKVRPEDLLKNTALLTDVLKYHVIPGIAIYTNDMSRIDYGPTLLAGKGLTLYKSPFKPNPVRVYFGKISPKKTSLDFGGAAQVVIKDVAAGHSVVQVINKVMLP